MQPEYNQPPVPTKYSKRILVIIVSAIALLLVVVGTVIGLAFIQGNDKDKNSVNLRLELSYVSSIQGTLRIESRLPSDTEFSVQCAKDDGFNQLVFETTTKGLIASCSGLLPTSTYYARAKIENDTWSNVVQFSTPSELDLPENLKSQNVTNDSMSLIWQSVDGASSYSIQYSTDPSFVKDTTTRSSSVTDIVIEELVPDTEYFVRVRAEKVDAFNPLAPYTTSINVITGSRD